MPYLVRLLALGIVGWLGVWFAAVAADEELTEDDRRWREKVGFNPQVHGYGANLPDREFFPKLPYAYYPYANELEVVFDLEFARRLLPADVPAPALPVAAVEVRVLPAPIAPEKREEVPFYYGPEPAAPLDPGRAVATFTLPLDAQGRGIGRFALPRLAAGNYRVEYGFGGVTLTAAKTFWRTYFEWEHNTLGLDRKVYAPFVPVQVAGRTVTVVDRTYTINMLGLLDSVVSQGRELLAEPMTLVVEWADGSRAQWRPGDGLPANGVEGRVAHPDEAVFTCAARTPGLGVQSVLAIEEDGCIKVRMTLAPEPGAPRPMARAWLEMALQDTQAPLCHLVGMNSMRHNYAGAVPRGGTITWIHQPWRPARFEVEPFPDGQAPATYEVWDATKNMHWGSQRWNFAPYVWLGAEERGLAWFGDHPGGYEVEDRHGRGIQRLAIEPGRVVLRVELVQRPVTLEGPRTIEFGLQASPTKPLRPDWRGYAVPGGGGMSVVVWGGFNCADKVPANRDWTIVDKVMEGARTGKADWEWFATYAQTHTTLINEGGGAKPGVFRRVPLEQAKANGQPWLTALGHFVGRAAGLRPDEGITVYYEEHQTSGAYPDVAEFHDEWADNSFSRYRMFHYPYTWGPEARSANPPSYRDFAVYYANEWMRRGVGIYYDNTYPMLDHNRHRLQDRGLPWQSSIWGHREYYKRVWKGSRELMESGQVTRPLHTVGHVTNCQVLPFTTWWDATLGVESPGHWVPDVAPTPEQRQQALAEWGFLILPTPRKDATGVALPYPPDYLRAMECGRTAGVIPHYRHLLRGEDALGGLGIGYGATDRPAAEVRAHRLLSDKAMGMIHEIRGGASAYDHAGIQVLTDAFREYGYGRPEVTTHNYWAEPPLLAVDDPRVLWLVLEKPDMPLLLLLQSYAPDEVAVRLGLPADALLLDLFTRRAQPAAEPVAFAADYGTRLFLAGDAAQLAPLAWPADVLLRGDFEWGLPPAWKSYGQGAPRIVADPQQPGNRVLRVTPGHPSQNHVSGKTEGAYELSLRFRLPALPEAPPHAAFYGLLQVVHREVGAWPKQNGQVLQVGIQKGAAGPPTLALVLANRRAGEPEPFRDITLDRLKEIGALVPLDTAWHTLAIAVDGHRHTIRLDDVEVFSGTTDVTAGGTLALGPGWGNWSPGYIDVDDLVVRAPATAAPPR